MPPKLEIRPNRQDFIDAYNAGKPQLLWCELIADLLTPVAAMVKLGPDRPYCFLLESVQGGEVRGRYSIIGLRPDLIWRCKDQKAEICYPLVDPTKFSNLAEPTLVSLKRLVRDNLCDLPTELPPMAGALVGYLGYDMIRLIEKLPDNNPDDLAVPDGVMMRPTLTAIFDTIKDIITLSSAIRPQPDLAAEQAYEQGVGLLAEIADILMGPVPETSETVRDFAKHHGAGPEKPISNTGHNAFMNVVEKARDYIKAGDAFQVVASHRFEMPFELPPFSFYRALRRLNPSPYLFYLNFDGFQVAGSSPEILVRLRDEEVTIRPIAGTRPRGQDAAADLSLEQELLADPKERAEHLMLLDLGRNDVGRVAQIGSVHPTERFVVERYSHVMHIVSNVVGKLDSKFDAIDVLFAGFPAGTVSGAPKVRAMEIIDELEVSRRGIYGGGIGYFAANGSMDTCIALRTAVMKDKKIYVQAGAGIVYDSQPQAEYQETVNKAMALIRAAESAHLFV